MVTILEELEVLIEKGIYKDREDLIRDALRTLLRSKPELRRELAIEHYKRGQVSLARATELCGIDLESFKEILRERGIQRVIPSVGEVVQGEVEEILSLHKT